jgi:arylsulfatase
VRNLADTHPDKLAELEALWWKEAERYQVLPLNNQPGRFGDQRFRRERHVFHPGIGRLPEVVAPNLRNRGFVIEAHLNVPASVPVDGALVAHGGGSGGYALYLKGRRLHFVHNLLGMQSTTVSASVELPAGRVVARAVFKPTGPFRGDVALFYDGVPVGEGSFARTTPVTYGMGGFAVGYQPGSPVSEACPGRFAVPEGLLSQVVIEAEGAPYRDPAAEARVAMAKQ